MNKGKITVAGIGPGSREDITPAALSAIRQSDVIIGYNYYFQFIQDIIRPDAQCIDTGMKREKARAEEAYKYASEGKTVTVISSGDAGIYGMAPLIYEMRAMKEAPQVEIEVVPGISAFQKAASLLGAPIGHDLCIISLSDLMTPWLRIEKRIRAAAIGDFVTAIYNPKSEGRYWQLHRLKELFLEERAPETPVGYVRQAGREEQVVNLTTLAEFDPEQVDMFTVILIGNSQSYEADGKFITPRGYYGEIKMKTDVGIGQRKNSRTKKDRSTRNGLCSMPSTRQPISIWKISYGSTITRWLPFTGNSAGGRCAPSSQTSQWLLPASAKELCSVWESR